MKADSIGPSARRPVDLVVEHVERWRPSLRPFGEVVDLVIYDVRNHAALEDVQRLQTHDGRDHLSEAYFAGLSFVGLLAAELDACGATLDDPIAVDQPNSWRLIRVQAMLWDHVRTVMQLRAMIEERPS